MIRANRKNPWVNRWVSRIWDLYYNDPPVDLLTGYRGTDTLSVEPNTYWRNGTMGREIYCDQSSFNNALILGSDIQDNTRQKGFTVMFKLDSAVASGIVRYGSMGLEVDADGTVRGTGSAGGVASGAGVIQPGRWHIVTYLAQQPSGTDYARLWVDGKYIGEDSASVHDASGNVSLFMNPTGTRGMVGSICYFVEHTTYYHYGEQKWPTEGEVKKFHDNPWVVFERPMSRIIGAHELPTDVRFATIKKPWTKKPPAATPIDWSNSLTTDLALVDLVDPDLGMKDATGNFSKASDTDAIPDVVKHGNWGRGLWFDRTATDQTRRYGWEQNGELTGIPAITVLSLNRITYENPTTTYHWFAGVDRSGFLAWRLYRTGNTGNARRYLFSIEVSDTTYSNDTGVASPLNDFVPHCVVGRYQSGEVLDLWLDGHLYSERTAGAPVGNMSDEPTFPVTVNGSSDASGSILDSPIDDEHYCLMIWTRALSDGEIKSISANPWQIFEPQEVMVPFNEALPELAKFEDPRPRFKL